MLTPLFPISATLLRLDTKISHLQYVLSTKEDQDVKCTG